MTAKDSSTFDIFPYFEAGACALPLLKPNAMKKKNDCYTCPYREQVPGSAHSACKAIENNLGEAAKTLIKFDLHGVRNGWCFWPLNFDPVWVECYLPIEGANNDKE